MKKIKVARIVASPSSFISLMPVLSILSQLEDLEVHLVSSRGEYQKYLSANFPHFKIHTVAIAREISLLSDIKSLLSLSCLFFLEGFDVVHSHTPKAGLLTALAAFFTGRSKRIHTFTGQVWVDYKGGKKIFFKAIDRLICFLNSFCYVDGPSQQKFLIENGVGNLKKLRVLGVGSLSGLDTDRFTASKVLNIRESLRAEMFPSFNGKIILFLGRINLDKGIKELLEAFLNLEKKYSVKLLLVGPDELKNPILIEKISILKKKGSLVQIDFSLNVEHFYVASDIYCLPTYREGCPVSILEASSMELPVVASNIYGVVDTMVNEETGLLFEVKNSGDLYEKLDRLLSNESVAKNFGKAGREFVHKNFQPSKIAQELVTEYRQSLKRI